MDDQKNINSNPADQTLAVIGIACRFPGANNYEAFWQNLLHEVNSIKEIPNTRWPISKFYKENDIRRDANQSCSKWAGLLEKIDEFDADFFHISPREAENMDPQQRLALQEAWHCIEDAGIPLAVLQDNTSSVFAGVMAVDYQHYATNLNFPVDSYACLGNYAGIIANRISHTFKFTGESQTIDTACSSSLVALHAAGRSILSRQSDYALVVGVNIICHPWKYISFSKSFMLSPHGQCKTFDLHADGYVPGEGIGALLLCSLTQAKALGHKIYGLINGCAVNHNGGAAAITVPNVQAQVRVINKALEQAQIKAKEISYVEMHGTGTSLGDPIEIEALSQVMKDHSCLVGSVKTNIGHLEAAAGIAGIIKVLMMLKYKYLVPSLNLREENPLINFSQISLKPVLKLTPWQTRNPVRRASVSSFGFGGVNAHCIVSEYYDNNLADSNTITLPAYPFLLSAKSSKSLYKLATNFLKLPEQNQLDVKNLCFSLMNRCHFDYRFSVYASNWLEIKASLNNFITQPSVYTRKPKLEYDFVFSQNLELKKEQHDIFNNHFPLFKIYYKAFVNELAQHDTIMANELISHITTYSINPSLDSAKATFLYYLYVKFLIAAGVQPHLIAITKKSLLIGCLICEIIDLKQAVTLLQNQKKEVTIRPACFPLVLGNKSYVVLELEVIKKLIKKADINEELGLQILTIGRKLFCYQFTFKRYIEDYAKIVNSDYFNLTYLLQTDTTINLSKQNKLILSIILGSALHKLNKKWQLTNKYALGSNVLECLCEGIAENVLPLSFVINSILDIDSPAIELEIETINKCIIQQKAYSLVAKIYEILNIEYTVSSLEELYSHIKHRVKLNLNLSHKPLIIEASCLDYSATFQVLVDAWHNGYLINWQKIFNVACFKTIPLPGYEFDTQQFWLKNRGQEMSESTYDQIKLLQQDNHTTTQQRIVLKDRFASDDPNITSPIIQKIQLKSITSTINHKFTKEKESIEKHVEFSLQESEKIAIIGFSGQFPGAQNCEEFWQKLTSGYCAITEVPKNRWDIEQYYHPDKTISNKSYSKWGGFLSDIAAFDPHFFNLLPDDALLMDPQQRLILEQAWNALEVSGYVGERLNKYRCGIYVGVMNNDYYEKILGDRSRNISAAEYIGNHNSILAARAAYFLDLKGPAIAIDTACSSSLVSIHLACAAIHNKDADIMLAGGVTLYLTETPYISMSKANMLSPDGLCKTFDNRANGFVPAEGVGFIVLKKLEHAIRDHDKVYAIINGSGINQDGRSNGITAPNLEAQKDLITSIYKRHAINPEEISYIEAHGTGTKLGDPVEITALTKAFSEFTTKKSFCAMGSVKSNIGHTSAASGVISVIKTLLCLQHKKLVPSINFSTPNEHLHLNKTPFYVNTTYQDWKKKGSRRTAAISSFGFSGTNCHLVISEYASSQTFARSFSTVNYYPIPLSAKTKTALNGYIQKLSYWLINNSTIHLSDVSYTLCFGRAQFKYRYLFWVSSIEMLIEQLTSNVTVNNLEQNIYKNMPLALQNISDNYMNHKDVHWDSFFDDLHELNFIYLPTYCFDKKHYYFENKIKQQKENEQDKNFVKLNNDTIIIESIVDSEDSLLTEHLVQGQKILPAAAIIEMVITHAKKKLNINFPFLLEELHFYRPIVDDSNNIRLQIQLTTHRNANYFVEINFWEEGSWQKAAAFKIIVNQISAPKKIFLDSFRKQLISRMNSYELYQKLASINLCYGKTFQIIEEIQYNHQELVASLIVLPLSKQVSYTISPTVIDAACHCVIAIGEYPSTFVPSHIKSIRIHSHFKDKVFLYARQVQANNSIKVFNIYGEDEKGRVLLEINELVLRVMTQKKKLDKTSESALLIYQASWQQTYQKDFLPNNAVTPREHALFFLANKEIDDTQYFKTVVNDSEFCIEKNRIRMNFNHEEHYFKMLTLLDSQQSMPSDIILVWNASEKSISCKWDMARITEYVLYPLWLAKAIIKHNKCSYTVRLSLVLWGKTAYDSLLFESLSSAVKTINLETNKLSAKLIHIYQKESSINFSLDSIWQVVVKESLQNETHVVYRDFARYTKYFHRKKYEESIRGLAFKLGGVYLITGGSGGLGFTLGQYLAMKYQAKVILIGRSKLSSEKIKIINEINEQCSNIQYAQADVTHKIMITNLISKIRNKYGTINGVIHCAGIIKDKFIRNKTIAEINEVLPPKILGTVNIDEATRYDKLDLFILFSSVAGTLGNIGQYDYAYANAFLNNYSQYRNLQVQTGARFGKTIAIGWPYWEVDGMHLQEEAKKWLYTQFGIKSITSDQGLKALEILVSLFEDDCLIVSGHQDTIEDKLIREELV